MRNVFLLIIFTLVSGCASFWVGRDVTATPPYHKPMYLEESYSISGRFSINSKHAHEYGNYTWVKQLNFEEMNFNTPLGQTVAKIRVESGIVTLTTKNQTYVGNDVDDMLYDNIGFDLPVSYLHYWVQGLPLPNQPITQYLPDGFEQMGWNVEYLEWTDPNHPHLIKCTNMDLVIKLLIDWS